MIRVLIVDDQPMVRSGLRSLLDAEPDLDVVGIAGDGVEAIDVALRLGPDVVLMDVRMPVMDGIAATRSLVSSQPQARVLMLTTYDLDSYVFDAMRAGASGFLLKDATAEELVDGIRTVAGGEAMLTRSATTRLIAEFARASGLDPDAVALVGQLTPREHEVLQGLAAGQSNSEIAGTLGVSPATVKTHVANVLLKLGVRDRVQAVIVAYESGVVRPGGRDIASSS